MPPSRQTLVNRRNDLRRLQDIAGDAPLVVSYRDGRGYLVSRPDAGLPLIVGRFEVIYAFLMGYRAASGASPATDPDATSN